MSEQTKFTPEMGLHHKRAEWCMQKWVEGLDASVGGKGFGAEHLAARNQIVKAFIDRDELSATCEKIVKWLDGLESAPQGTIDAIRFKALEALSKAQPK